ncbi:isopentenyl-diphosphate Delta-isomerase [Ferruginibacter sp. HRS2-29]|uniref:isopentenyl-diphosphate Delta-isomerase n=1 Tax=Ferruginibacter sp. HRS2-29 TaxID=2487334 RepID=UPI0020CE24C2|nr:isopentenyl-diphosphate Delta-isomerase [Ferruginibacter sp. HRS2-29]
MTDLILVNANDEAIGFMEKMEVHQKGLLHRAFSIFIFNSKGEMLLQQRADNKYHSAGLWTNACCSHPQASDTNIEAAVVRRLHEEMGFTTKLTRAFTFTYKTEFDNGLTEHELDHVYTGMYDGDIHPDAREVKDYCFMTFEAIRDAITSHPQKYTSWFKIAFPKLEEYLAAGNSSA